MPAVAFKSSGFLSGSIFTVSNKDIYIFCYLGSTRDSTNISIFKSTDGGSSFSNISNVTGATIHGTAGTGGSYWASADIDSAGYIHCICQCLGNNTRSVAYSKFNTSTDSWDPWEAALATYNDYVSSEYSCHIVVDQNDKPHAVYVDRISSMGTAYTQVRYVNKTGSSWTSPVTVPSTSTISHRSPELVSDSSGNITCIYRANSADYIRWRTRSSGGTWGSEITIGSSFMLFYAAKSTLFVEGYNSRYTMIASSSYRIQIVGPVSIEDTNGLNAISLERRAGAITMFNNKGYMWFYNQNRQLLFMTTSGSNLTGGQWSTPTVVLTADTAQAIGTEAKRLNFNPDYRVHYIHCITSGSSWYNYIDLSPGISVSPSAVLASTSVVDPTVNIIEADEPIVPNPVSAGTSTVNPYVLLSGEGIIQTDPASASTSVVSPTIDMRTYNEIVMFKRFNSGDASQRIYLGDYSDKTWTTRCLPGQVAVAVLAAYRSAGIGAYPGMSCYSDGQTAWYRGPTNWEGEILDRVYIDNSSWYTQAGQAQYDGFIEKIEILSGWYGYFLNWPYVGERETRYGTAGRTFEIRFMRATSSGSPYGDPIKTWTFDEGEFDLVNPSTNGYFSLYFDPEDNVTVDYGGWYAVQYRSDASPSSGSNRVALVSRNYADAYGTSLRRSTNQGSSWTQISSTCISTRVKEYAISPMEVERKEASSFKYGDDKFIVSITIFELPRYGNYTFVDGLVASYAFAEVYIFEAGSIDTSGSAIIGYNYTTGSGPNPISGYIMPGTPRTFLMANYFGHSLTGSGPTSGLESGYWEDDVYSYTTRQHSVSSFAGWRMGAAAIQVGSRPYKAEKTEVSESYYSMSIFAIAGHTGYFSEPASASTSVVNPTVEIGVSGGIYPPAAIASTHTLIGDIINGSITLSNLIASASTSVNISPIQEEGVNRRSIQFM